MKPSAALEVHREAARAIVAQSRAANLRVFGSAMRGDDTEQSDLDLLVDALPGATLLDLGGLQMDLQDLFGVRVDLLTPGDLPREIRSRVLAEAVPV